MIMNHSARRQTLLAAMSRSELDAVVLVPGPNFRYLTGGILPLRGRPTMLLLSSDGAARALVPSLEETSWDRLGIDADVEFWRDADGYADALRRTFAKCSSRRIGIEGQLMRAFELRAIEAAASGAAIVDAHKEISSIRLCKDDSEIEVMRQAIRFSETALGETIRAVRVGMSEREIQARLVSAAMATGADGLAFPPIVAGGPNSAMSHAKAGDYRLKPGDALLFDFGITCQGYCADITRTFFVGEPDQADLELYRVVQAANALGRNSARTGMAAGHLDEIVTDFLKASPFSDRIRHRTGHGLGLDVHEEPFIQHGNGHRLEKGNVFTIEPGLYVPGRIGVRIEDDVAMSEDSAMTLSTFSRDATVIGIV